MPTLRQRIDVTSISATFLPLPKGKKRGRAVGFRGGEPVASLQGTGTNTPPFRWIGGTPQAVTFQDLKTVVASGTSAAQLSGLYYTSKHDQRALVWTPSADDGLSGVELHPRGWEKSSASACGDGQQVGYGYERFTKDPSRALLWSGSVESMVVLTGPDPTRDSTAQGVAEGVQVGSWGNSLSQRACLWRGTSASHVDLHPSATTIIGSAALATGDGQQVGQVWGEQGRSRAALWSGSAESYVDLAPRKFAVSTAWRCARGFQVGWANENDTGMKGIAMLWGGAADDYIDLQAFLPAPWNCSQAMDLYVDGDTLRVLGTANQAVMSNGYEVNAAEQPVLWEMKLLIAETPARHEAPSAVRVTATATTPEVDDERRVEQTAEAFATAMINDDYAAAHQLLAPWLAKQVTAKLLREILTKEFLADTQPVDFVIAGNESTLDELRSHFQEYYKDDKARTLGSLTEYGMWGPPSVSIADEITPANFKAWLSFDLTPDPDNEWGLDYMLRVFLIVVEIDGVMRIGYIEPSQ